MKKMIVSAVLIACASQAVSAGEVALEALLANAPAVERVALPEPSASQIKALPSAAKMGRLVSMLGNISRQLEATPGAPVTYVREIKGIAVTMNGNYTKLMAAFNNGDINDRELDSFRAQMKRLEAVLVKIGTSPNYVQLRGPELAQILQGMKKVYEEWEYDLSQAGS